MSRTRRSRQSGQVLIIIFGALFFGASSAVTVGLLVTGRSLDDLKKETRAVVTDAAARERADALYDRWKHLGDDFFESRKEQEEELLELVSRHDATHADFEQAIGVIDRQNARTWDEVLEILVGLRAEIPAQDWQRVFPPPEPGEKP